MTVWLVQYRHEQDRAFERNLEPGALVSWRINPFKPATIAREAQEGDLVVIWRTKDNTDPEDRELDDGGIIGWGRVDLAARAADSDQLAFVVTHAFPRAPTPRKNIIEALSLEVDVANFWPGQVALKRLNDQEATIIEGFRPADPPDEPMWHPLASGHPPEWASGWGQDDYGVFVEFTVAEVSQRLRWCPPGDFLLGSPKDEAERYETEGPQVRVRFSKGFWLFDTPVTFALYNAVLGQASADQDDKDLPLTEISWNDAQDFLGKLNAKIPGLELRLPSEAEWEYACRAGSQTPFEPNVARQFGGNTITVDEANYDGNPYGKAPKGTFRDKAIPVKEHGFRPNKWGLWQMHGNGWEWCEDVWNNSHEGAAIDGAPRQASQQAGKTYRVVRGGSWRSSARNCRSAYRNRNAPVNRIGSYGFRPARGQ